MSCEYAHLDGSYVLGALSPSERREFEEHLAGCERCTRAVGELAGLPGLLSRVDADVLEGTRPEEPVPHTLLPSLLGEVRRTERRRTFLTAGVAAAAAVLVTIGAAVTVGVTDDGNPGSQPSASVAVARPMTLVHEVGMRASLGFASVPWGTRLDLTCSYEDASPGYRDTHPSTYSLVVHTRDGSTEQVATWRALPGRTMQLSGATSAARDDITSVEVRTPNGEPVLRLAG